MILNVQDRTQACGKLAKPKNEVLWNFGNNILQHWIPSPNCGLSFNVLEPSTNLTEALSRCYSNSEIKGAVHAVHLLTNAYPIIHMHLNVHHFFVIRHYDIKTICSETADTFIHQKTQDLRRNEINQMYRRITTNTFSKPCIVCGFKQTSDFPQTNFRVHSGL